jgi:hypothetical protein
MPRQPRDLRADLARRQGVPLDRGQEEKLAGSVGEEGGGGVDKTPLYEVEVTLERRPL